MPSTDGPPYTPDRLSDADELAQDDPGLPAGPGPIVADHDQHMDPPDGPRPPESGRTETFTFQHDEDGALSLKSAVFQALGYASACWENLRGAGVFESDRAKDCGEQLLALIQARYGLIDGAGPATAKLNSAGDMLLCLAPPDADGGAGEVALAADDRLVLTYAGVEYRRYLSEWCQLAGQQAKAAEDADPQPPGQARTPSDVQYLRVELLRMAAGAGMTFGQAAEAARTWESYVTSPAPAGERADDQQLHTEIRDRLYHEFAVLDQPTTAPAFWDAIARTAVLAVLEAGR